MIELIVMMVQSATEVDSGLVAHWPLTQDCRDSSGNGFDGENHGVVFADGAAVFDGRGAHIAVPNNDSLALKDGDFSVAAWIHTEQSLDDTLGDIVGKFDPATRTGFNLVIQNFSGVTSAQPNFRHLLFGLDAATEAKPWRDCGRPGNAVFVLALAAHEGTLYAGTCEAEAAQTGHVYRYDGADRWIDCGSPDGSNAVCSLAVCDGQLYAGTGRYKLEGSALPHSPNETPGGRVFRYDGAQKWVDCGPIGDADMVMGMAVYKGKLFAMPAYHKGVYRYDGDTTWTYCGTPGTTVGPMFGDAKDETLGCRLISLAVHDGFLYGAGNGRDQGVFRYEGGEQWTNVGKPEGVDQVYSFMQYQGKLLTGTWPNAHVFRYDDNDAWTNIGRLGEELEVMAMAVYNGMLYAGSLPLAEVYRYDGQTQWTNTGRLDMTPDVKYRRAWSMAVFDGKLFCGTLPSGRVYALQAGDCVTHDAELKPGWRHVAAVRQGSGLALFVDGQRVAERHPSDPSAPSDPSDQAKQDLLPALNIANSVPLTIGFGAHDYFNGKMRDMRVYNRALSEAETKNLAGK